MTEVCFGGYYRNIETSYTIFRVSVFRFEIKKDRGVGVYDWGVAGEPALAPFYHSSPHHGQPE